MNSESLIALEHPPFAQFMRQIARLTSAQVRECLERQHQTGGRLGEVFRQQGLCSRKQVRRALQQQAQWVANLSRIDMGFAGLPYPAFLSLCLPAYNERDNIVDTLDAATAILPAFVARYEIIVVDDGSRDGTGDLVERYAAKAPHVRLVRHESNGGYGAAVTTGLRAARGDLIAFTDADGQFSLLDLPPLLARIAANDVVVGYRYDRADPRVRRFNAWAWNWLIRTVLGVWVRDLDCAFKLFRREVIDQLRLSARGAAINAEIMAQVVHRGWRLCELPVHHYPRYHGAPTGAALRVIYRAFRELPRLWRYRFEAQAPAEPIGHVSPHPPPLAAAPPALAPRGVEST